MVIVVHNIVLIPEEKSETPLNQKKELFFSDTLANNSLDDSPSPNKTSISGVTSLQFSSIPPSESIVSNNFVRKRSLALLAVFPQE